MRFSQIKSYLVLVLCLISFSSLMAVGPPIEQSQDTEQSQMLNQLEAFVSSIALQSPTPNNQPVHNGCLCCVSYDVKNQGKIESDPLHNVTLDRIGSTWVEQNKNENHFLGYKMLRGFFQRE